MLSVIPMFAEASASVGEILPFFYDGTMGAAIAALIAGWIAAAAVYSSIALTSVQVVQQQDAAKRLAKAASDKAEQDAIRARVEGDRLRGSQRVAFAKSGVDLSELGGTQLEVLAQTAEDAELNQLRNRFSGDFAASSIQARSDEQTLQGLATITNTVLGSVAKTSASGGFG